MKTRSLLLVLSVLANAGLVLAFFARPTARPVPGPGADTSPGRPAASPAPAGGLETVGADAAATGSPDFSWSALEASDLDELAAQLKAAGFSPADIRSMLQHRIAQLGFSSQSALNPSPYWRTHRLDSADPKAAAEMRARMAEQMRLYRKYAEGPEGFDDPARVEAARRQWGDLSIEKLRAVAEIEADYRELTVRQYAERRHRPGEEIADDATLERMIQEERLADIAQVLSPEEFAAFELRASPTAHSLRYRLDAFRPTEEEYKAIFAITKEHGNQPVDPTLSPAARQALAAEINARVSQALGADRAADYDAAMNHNSQDQTARLVSRLNLPARVAVEVRQMQADFTQRANELRENPALAAGARNAELDALARQAEVQLARKLGPDGFEVYNDLKGEWIRAIKPKPGG